MNTNESAKIKSQMSRREEMDVLVRQSSLGSVGGAGRMDVDVSSAPIVRLVNRVIDDAIERRASDIHIEPQEDELRVRFRVDGELVPQYGGFPLALRDTLTSRIKIMAHLDTTERRKPQDGRITHKHAGRDVDIRVSTMPLIHGESIVLRLLNGSREFLSLDELNFSEANEKMFRGWMHSPYGLILATGPVNSGKSTTLYAALSELNTKEKNIVTIEDPVECHLAGVNQMQVNQKVDLTFAAGLRAILRQDPDVCMVGEIRDEETAEIAVRAALTGRLLFTTLHTGNAIGAIFRLLDMGIAPYLLSAALSGIMAQRLVRRLCPHCRERYEVAPDSAEARILGEHYREGMTMYRNVGCDACGGEGYSGRLAIHELLTIGGAMRDAITHQHEYARVEAEAKRAGMVSLIEDGISKAERGETTLSEIGRVLYGEP